MTVFETNVSSGGSTGGIQGVHGVAERTTAIIGGTPPPPSASKRPAAVTNSGPAKKKRKNNKNDKGEFYLPILCRMTKNGEILIPVVKKNGRHCATSEVIDVDDDDNGQVLVPVCDHWVREGWEGPVATQVLKDYSTKKKRKTLDLPKCFDDFLDGVGDGGGDKEDNDGNGGGKKRKADT